MMDETIVEALAAVDNLIAENRELRRKLEQAQADRAKAQTDSYVAQGAAQTSAARSPRSG